MSLPARRTKIVIAGGGFAGLTAARYFDQGLARRGDIEVVLISRENFTLFTPMLHEVAAGDLYPGDIVNPLRRVLHRRKRPPASVVLMAPSSLRSSSSLIICFSLVAPKQIFSISTAFGTWQQP